MRAYLGAASTTGPGSPASGITVMDIDGATFTPVGVAETSDPMYLALSADGTVLYSLAERAQGQVRAWKIDGECLTALGEPQETGGGPCHLSVHSSGRYLLTASYGSGTLAVHPILADGALAPASDTIQHTGTGPNSERQERAHAHMIVTDPGTGPGRGHVLAADLGTDTVYRYALDEATGTLDLVDELHAPPGAGPRHLVIRDQYAYVANELDSTVTVIDLAAGSVLSTVSTRPDGAGEASHPSAIRISADGSYLYVANRFVDEIAVLAVSGPELSLVTGVPCGGDHPRDIVLSPDGAYLYSANQFGDTITSFEIDPGSGVPQQVGSPFSTPSPACIVWAHPR
ncbi:lactonase family protein [Phytoactinopolyspora alkaliphila]|uniref:Lactonase family protein n=1 Tax=Phytoactinopolyspora alkaliphila TaxID=1783498 RepID=A0A6N9YLD9_9ACTN|nr:lactonase family protein [Phytoactinopolyspora alkaliphila]NED95775.1 lactonase family protein [Phytoactinopolyspora alkaliphila]